MINLAGQTAHCMEVKTRKICIRISWGFIQYPPSTAQ